MKLSSQVALMGTLLASGAAGTNTSEIRTIKFHKLPPVYLPEIPNVKPRRWGVTKPGWRKEQSVRWHKETMRRQRRNASR